MDGTERHGAKRVRDKTPVHATEAPLRLFIAEAPVPIAMFDRELRYLAASESWIAGFCRGRGDVVGRSHDEVGPELPERWRNAQKRALAGEASSAEVDAFPHPHGHTQWMTWSVRPWHGADRAADGVTIFAHDVTSKVEADRLVRESNARAAAETAALMKLHELGSQLWRVRDLHDGLMRVLEATIAFLGADMGNIQLVDAKRKVLRIAVQRGFQPDYLESFDEVSAEDESACGRALRTGQTVVVEDVELEASFAPFRPIARAAGFRAVASAPLIGRDGGPLGMLSTHFRSPHRPTDLDLGRVTLYLHRAANFIERCKVEEALRESEERLRLAVEVGRMAMWDWNLKTNAVSWNEAHYPMLGYEVGAVEPSYEAWARRVHPDDRAASEAAVAKAMRERTEYGHTFRVIHPDGSVRWCAARGRYFYDAEGSPWRMIGLMQDVTEGRRSEEVHQLLVAELQHRTRNLITVVQSIAQQTLTTAGTLEAFRDRFDDRLAALARAQGLLSRSNKAPITIGALLIMEFEALGVMKGENRVVLNGPEVQLRRTMVQTLALAVHELATNARKYGALASDRGRLSVKWRIDGAESSDRRLALEWTEWGLARQPAPSDRTRIGYGRTLIERGLPYALSARTKFELDDDNLRCSITLPLGATLDGT